MKRIVLAITAVAALAACTKSEVAYEAPGEIGFAPAVKNVTKAAKLAGNLDASQKLNVWAYWDKDGAVENAVADYDAYDVTFLDEASFAQKTANGGITAWGGDGVAYPWPVNGALVFSGYTTPTSAETGVSGYDVTYTLGEDKMVFTNYTQSANTASTFDLCWFNHTAGSHNNRATGTAVDVTLSHALTWITIKAYGEGTPVASGSKWKIKSITLKDVVTVGTGTCIGTGAGKATWTLGSTKSDVAVFSSTDGINIPSSETAFETTTNGTVVIPQTPVQMEVVFDYPVGTSRVEETVTVNLTLDGSKDKDGKTNTAITTWQSGYHYTYTLFFKGNEILVAPSYGAWTDSNQTVTVE